MRTTFSSCDTSERRLSSQCLSNKAGLCAFEKESTDFVGYDDPKGAVVETFRGGCQRTKGSGIRWLRLM